MKKQFKWVVKNGNIILLKRGMFGIFGEQWDSIARFTASPDNIARGKQIIRYLNECAQHSENQIDNDRDRNFGT